jgi:hypothetical protein
VTRRALAVVLAGCAGAQDAAPSPASCTAVVIASATDVERVSACPVVGSLVVRTGAPIDLGGLAVREVRGDVTIGPTVAASEIQLPAIERIGGALRISANGSVTGVFAPKLRDAGSVAIVDNPALATVALPALATVGGDFVVRNNAALEIVLAPSLATVRGEVAMSGVPRLVTVNLGAVPGTIPR